MLFRFRPMSDSGTDRADGGQPSRAARGQPPLPRLPQRWQRWLARRRGFAVASCRCGLGSARLRSGECGVCWLGWRGARRCSCWSSRCCGCLLTTRSLPLDVAQRVHTVSLSAGVCCAGVRGLDAAVVAGRGERGGGRLSFGLGAARLPAGDALRAAGGAAVATSHAVEDLLRERAWRLEHENGRECWPRRASYDPDVIVLAEMQRYWWHAVDRRRTRSRLSLWHQFAASQRGRRRRLLAFAGAADGADSDRRSHCAWCVDIPLGTETLRLVALHSPRPNRELGRRLLHVLADARADARPNSTGRWS